MSDESKPKGNRILGLAVLILLGATVYTIATGGSIKRVNIPGLFEMEFAQREDAPLPAEPDSVPTVTTVRSVPASTAGVPVDIDGDGVTDVQYWDSDGNGDGVTDYRAFDTNLNGVIDQHLYFDSTQPGGVIYGFDPRETGVVESWGWDTDADGRTDTWAWDRNGNQVFDQWGWDTDRDGLLDLYGYDANEDGAMEEYREQ